jgi:hypothetical protein
MNSKFLIAPVAILLLSAAAVADVVSYNVEAPIGGGVTAFDFNALLTIPQFNGSIGTLTSISLTLTGTATANQDFENKSNASATVTMTSTGTMTLRRPNNTALVVAVPTIINTKSVAAFDGANDSAGTSGFTFSPTTVSASDTQVYSGVSDLALFTGGLTISLPFTATGTSSATGSASLSTGATMTGSAVGLVTYTYTPFVSEVPEPSTYGSIGAVAIVGCLGYRRFRKSANKVG